MSERSTLPLAGSASLACSHVIRMGRVALFVVAALAVEAALARTIVVPPPAMPEYADPEASTNIAFNADDAHLREFEMRFALEGSLSNCVQVALGRDLDGDGALGADEAETLYGWRNGRYFAESVNGGVRVEDEPDGVATSRVFAVNFRLSKGRGLRHFTATNATGVAVLPTLSADAQKWLYRPDWNMMRVTRRGPGVPAEWFSCDISSHFFYIKLR